MIAFRRPPSLRNLLVRAEVPPTNDSSIPPIQHGMFRCTSRCVTCQEHILESDSFKSHTTGAHHKIRGHITCTTSNIIYLISCRICGIQYIGEMKNSFKKRFYGHRSTVKTQKLDTPVGQHFNLPSHSISDMIFQGIEALANRRESVRLSREKIWIKRIQWKQIIAELTVAVKCCPQRAEPLFLRGIWLSYLRSKICRIIVIHDFWLMPPEQRYWQILVCLMERSTEPKQGSGILHFFRSPRTGLFSVKIQKEFLAINNFFCQWNKVRTTK